MPEEITILTSTNLSGAILICIVVNGCLFAQSLPNPFASTHNSAAIDSAQFELNIPDVYADDPTMVHQVIFRDPEGSSWNEVTMNELYQACTLQTYSAGIELNTSSSFLEWYNRSENDTAVATQSPKNSDDAFPVPAYLQADLGADPVGDAEDAAGSYLDITHCYASYSDAKLYFRLDNNGGGFPTSAGFTWFIYSVGILDPDASDAVAYALVYANVPLLLSPGLYAISAADSSFTKISDIETSVSGNSLSMSCDIASLTAQPGWSDWPPPSGFIGASPVTATQSLTDLATNDIGKYALYMPESNMADFLFNQAPVLSNGTVEVSDSGMVFASVTYTDSDGHLAVVRDFHFGSEVYLMTACEKGYTDGALFETSATVDSTGWHNYYFEFSDGAETVSTVLDSVYVAVVSYVAGDADGSGGVDIDDIVYLVSYIFSGGPVPDPMEAGDADCSGGVDIDDAVFLINFIFSSGPPPCSA